MHINQTTGTTLASAIVTGLVDLDEKLKTADLEDRAELRERLSQIDPREFTYLLDFAAVASIVLAPAEEEEPSAPESEAVATMDAPKETPAHV
jgi:hypothetical protein